MSNPSDALPARDLLAPRSNEEQDTRNKLSHILADEPQASVEQPPRPQEMPPAPGPPPQSAAPLSTTGPVMLQPALQPRIKEDVEQTTPGNGPLMGDMNSGNTSGGENKPNYTATTTTTRRNANGSVSSVYSGNKIRHLKKEDGVPLWRSDIQYDFLKYVFEDEQKVFHKMSDKSGGHTFADIYLDAMAKSSKCSKILKDKLLTERPAALNMAMVCLLVNVGRMNTTLNFFPEMRAQLRTYHSIPSLQAQQDPNAYKQLQDAPRLKSILKGATEDTEQPTTLEDIRSAPIPRTNPVNLIFVLAQYAPKISEMHFDVPRDFFDLVMKPGLSSKSRATAFLWLMWWYLESDFSTEDALKNPYGPGRRSRDGDAMEMPIKTPQFDILTDEEVAQENVDTQEEIDFGETKKKERMAILATDMAPVITGPKRSSKKAYNQGTGVFAMQSDNDAGSPARDFNSPAPSQGLGRSLVHGQVQASGQGRDDQYDTDRTRSVSPSGSQNMALPTKPAGGMRINTLLNEDAPTPPAAAVVAQAHAAAPIPASAPTSTSMPMPTLTPAPAPQPIVAAATPTPAPSKGPGRGNWGHRRKEKEAQAQQQSSTPVVTSSGRTSIRPQHHISEEPEFAGGSSISSRPHGFYIPLNGQLVEPKRHRPLTSHQLAVEKYRRERVEFSLDQGLRKQHAVAKRKRTKESSMMRTWNRCANLPDNYDSEEERMAVLNGAEGLNGGMSQQGREGVAADALLMMAGLRNTPWEQNDYGEEAAYLASGMRKLRRRTDRWENGGTVVKKVKRDEGAEDGEDEGEPEEGYGDIERSSPAPVDDDEIEEERYEGNEMEEDD
ncbi:hypothetical protein FKW77_006915 [Venturia effusa]|uniref:Ino eighty subunit 1 n=1 Tax=Venturia effusa TaxID=50376 RepID=A0A517LB24_9PEZI|nr:hypothetical protein FKW77_006915 [Venturia effusa]